ncbi:MAG: glycosyltransferase [Rhodothermales bacterium]|nr:glycosyltransferase [Rhodothermales bacterium]
MSSVSSSERPTVALVGPVAPYRGGIAHFSNRLSQALAERADVRLVNFSRQYPALLFPGESQFEDTPWALPSQPLRMLDSVNPTSWVRTGRALAAMRADSVVFVHWLPFFVPAYLGVLWAMKRHAKRLGVPVPKVTLFLHNVNPHKRFPMTKPLMQALIGQADRYFTLSEHVTKDLQAVKPGADVYEGFHPLYDHYQPAYDPAEARAYLGLPNERTLLFFGYIRPYKGLDVLLEAMPDIHRKTGARLIVAGEFYNNEDELRGRVKALGLDGADGKPPVVRFFSQYIPNEEVHHYFSAADALVQPYRSATPSGVAQTAFFFGKPMVTTNLGVFAEVVPDGVAGVLVPPEDPQALADGVARFYEIGAERLAEGAAQQAERFSWDALVDKLLPFLTKR